MQRPIMAPLAALGVASLFACSPQHAAQTGTAGTASAAPETTAAGPMSPDQLPHQKPGLWRTSMTIEGLQRAMPTTEICMDAATESRMSVWSKSLRDGKCASSQFTRNLDGSISFKTVCTLGPGGAKVDSGTIVGDFNSSYKVSIDSVTTGAAFPGANGEHKMSIAATWLGPCAPGQKGGDVIMPNGKTMNMGGG